LDFIPGFLTPALTIGMNNLGPSFSRALAFLPGLV
jgi:hypothetical protein